jgi:lipid-A-disaccharide synthase
MSEVCREFPSYQFIVCAVKHIPRSEYEKYLTSSNIQFYLGNTYEVLQKSQAAVVTSGTATLETALFEVPQVVCYKTSPFSYQIAKRLIRVKYISLVNLILDKPAVLELIQDNCNANTISIELKKLLTQQEHRAMQIQQYKDLKNILGGKGTSTMVAHDIVMRLNK